MKDDVLMIMSIRHFQSVVDGNNGLDCEKIWFKGYREYELAPVINDFIANSNFKRYFITSDDAFIRYENFEQLKHYSKIYDIVTGWCLYRQNDSYTTITKPQNFEKLIFKNGFANQVLSNNILDYSYHTHEIHNLPDVIETAFTGWCYTGMSKKIWQEYPFQTLHWPFSSSDLLFSKRVISDKKYKMMAIKNAHCIHISRYNVPHAFDYNTSFNKKEIIKTF